MKPAYSLPALAGVMLLGLMLPASTPAAQEGIALAIIYDTSGSMRDPVADKEGRQTPKYLVANRALIAVANQIQAYTTNQPGREPRNVQAALFTFSGEGARPAIPFGPFDAGAFRQFAQRFSNPAGNTPLGNALTAATDAVLKSPLSSKHVLIVTDGMNTAGPTPAAVMPRLKQQAERAHSGFSVHFVAFDVDAKVFDPMKKLGATVVGASDEKQLNTQLDFILQKKILLEDEEPKK